MVEWIKINDREPRDKQNVIAVGTWCGEINGIGEDDFMCIGEWHNGVVEVDSDTYATTIIDVTHWMPLPDFPK
jgi:hypothetical protein